MDKARESDIAGRLQENLVSGLHQLNTELGKLVTSLEPSSEAPEEPAAEAEADTAGEPEA